MKSKRFTLTWEERNLIWDGCHSRYCQLKSGNYDKDNHERAKKFEAIKNKMDVINQN